MFLSSPSIAVFVAGSVPAYNWNWIASGLTPSWSDLSSHILVAVILVFSGVWVLVTVMLPSALTTVPPLFILYVPGASSSSAVPFRTLVVVSTTLYVISWPFEYLG